MFARRSVLTLTAAGLLALGLSAPRALAEDRLTVVTTTGMIADAARQVGGDLVDVTSLMGPGVDPHAYRVTRSDIAKVTGADLVLWNGLYLEAQMESFLQDVAGKTTVVAVAEALPKDRLRANDDYADKFDPHVWMDPDLWSLVVAEVQRALTEARPDAADTFAANAEAHQAQIARLAEYSRTALTGVPQEARILLTAHDAFGYFGQAYGFEVMGIQGISTESEAGLNRIAELVDLLVTRNVRAVFVESSVSDRNIRALIEGAAAKGHEVSIGGELFSDAMGPDGTYEATWIGMIDHNVTTIAGALGAPVPARGMDGRLAAGS